MPMWSQTNPRTSTTKLQILHPREKRTPESPQNQTTNSQTPITHPKSTPTYPRFPNQNWNLYKKMAIRNVYRRGGRSRRRRSKRGRNKPNTKIVN
jgi:hypothetical protein